MNRKGLQKFIGLVYTHPELPVACLVDTQVVGDDTACGNWLGHISDAHISELAEWKGKYYNDFDEFWNDVADHLNEINDKFNYEQEKEKFKRDVNYIVGQFWKDYICIQIDAGVEKDDS